LIRYHQLLGNCAAQNSNHITAGTAPRAYRLKASNAASPISTSIGTIPHLAHQTFTDPDVLDEVIHQAVAALNSERKRDPLGNRRISA
jgi:hypothetical protein